MNANGGAPLASTLVRKVFSIYVLVAVVLTCVQIGVEYRNTYLQVLEELNSTARAFEPGVSDALWNYQRSLLESIAQGVVNGRVVTAVDIGGDSEKLRVTMAHPGQRFDAQDISKRIDLSRLGTGGVPKSIGFMTLYSNHHVIIERLKIGVILIVIAAAIKTIGLWLIIVFFANHLLAKPLRRFTEQIGSLDLTNATEAPRITVGPVRHQELMYLGDAFNDLTSKVVANEQELKQLTATLEKRVEERTAELSDKNSALEAEIVVREEAERAMIRQRDFSQALINSIPEIFFLSTHTGNIVMLNPNSKQVLGISENDKSLRSILDFIAPADRERVDVMLQTVFARGEATCEAEMVFADTRVIPHYFVGHLTSVDDTPHAIVVGIDIKARREAEERMRQLALYDSLTNLPNRATLYDRLKHTLAAAKRRREMVGVLFLDLDGFKQINDQAGHDTGDAVLREVAQRLKDAVRASDTVSRYGGDEFVIIAASITDAASAATVATKLLQVMAVPIKINGAEYQVTASIGISLFPDHSTDIDQLLKIADAAMYRAKKRGKAGFEFFPV